MFLLNGSLLMGIFYFCQGLSFEEVFGEPLQPVKPRKR